MIIVNHWQIYYRDMNAIKKSCLSVPRHTSKEVTVTYPFFSLGSCLRRKLFSIRFFFLPRDTSYHLLVEFIPVIPSSAQRKVAVKLLGRIGRTTLPVARTHRHWPHTMGWVVNVYETPRKMVPTGVMNHLSPAQGVWLWHGPRVELSAIEHKPDLSWII